MRKKALYLALIIFSLILVGSSFHASELAGVEFSELKEGDAVTFEISDTPKGPAAIKVSKA